MPQVPRYQSQVDTNALPNMRVNTDVPLEAFGGGRSADRVTDAHIGVLQQVEQFALKEKQKADDVIASDFYAQTTKLKNDLLYDPKMGATNVNGEQVIQSDFIGDYDKRFDEGVANLEKNLRNPAQKAYAAELKKKIKGEYSANLQKHFTQESTKYAAQSMKSSVDTLQNDARLNWGDPNKIEENKKNIMGRIARFSQQYGIPKDIADQQSSEAVSKMHVGVIESITTAGNDQAAQKYFSDYKDDFTGDDKSAVEKVLMVSKVDGESQRRAASIVAKYPGDFQSQLNALDKIGDIKVQDETRRRLHNRNAEQKQAKEQVQQARIDGSVKSILDAKKNNNVPGFNYWDSVDPKIRAVLTPKEIKEITATVNPPPNTDWGVKGMLLDMAAKDPEKFQGQRLQEYYQYLDIGDREELHKYQIGMENKDRATMDKLTKVKAEKTALDSAAVGIGLDPAAKRKSANGRAYDVFGREANDIVRAKSLALGRELTPEEQEVEFRNFAKKVAIEKPGFFGGTNKVEKRIFEVNDASLINKDEYKLFSDRLKALGKPSSDADILKAWKIWKANAGN